jgi:transcription elongation factor GreA
MDEVHFMTAIGKKKLEEELEKLIKIEREQIKQTLAEARELGDLKENAEYHAAKEKQSLVEGKILELQNKLNKGQVVDVSQIKSDRIVFGATIVLFDPSKDKTVTYQIVGADEANIQAGKISYTSPLAKALLGKQEGDTVSFKAPKGIIEYEVEKISFI